MFRLINVSSMKEKKANQLNKLFEDSIVESIYSDGSMESTSMKLTLNFSTDPIASKFIASTQNFFFGPSFFIRIFSIRISKTDLAE